jgi:hypothetical protein
MVVSRDISVGWHFKVGSHRRHSRMPVVWPM